MVDFTHIDSNASIVILTGAGISAESGLETFRGAKGLWCGHRIEDVATPSAFKKNPVLVHDFYNQRRKNILSSDIQPNPAHLALSLLEKEWPAEVLVVTQNIDNLHERGGTQNLIHMHGEALRIFCQFCDSRFSWSDDLFVETRCSNCKKTNGLRPDIVWFEEMPYQMNTIEKAVKDCDLFISIGTSGNVYPAAGFVRLASDSGATTIECNLEHSKTASMFDHHLHGKASQTVPNLVNSILRNE